MRVRVTAGIFLAMRASHFGTRRGTQERNSRPQSRDFFARERAFGLDRREQQLLNRARGFACFDKAERGAHAAKVVGVPVRLRKDTEVIFAEQGGNDPNSVDAGNQLTGKPLTQRRHPIAKLIAHVTTPNETSRAPCPSSSCGEMQPKMQPYPTNHITTGLRVTAAFQSNCVFIRSRSQRKLHILLRAGKNLPLIDLSYFSSNSLRYCAFTAS